MNGADGRSIVIDRKTGEIIKGIDLTKYRINLAPLAPELAEYIEKWKARKDHEAIQARKDSEIL